ncbi:hypothetical protein IJ818_00390 [bacterium]|nr:hypothetical protein [bacterium]
MSKILKDIIGLPVKALSYAKTKFDVPFVTVSVDGGICSQICFYSLGKYFLDKAYRVKYDRSGFEKFGLDIDNKFAGNFDLLNVFKLDNFEMASKDEIDWIEKEIVPNLSDVNYELVNCNGSDKGYLDLYLISKCSSFITSLGSLAKTGAMLSENLLNADIIVSNQDKNSHSLKACKGANIVKIKNN